MILIHWLVEIKEKQRKKGDGFYVKIAKKCFCPIITVSIAKIPAKNAEYTLKE